jgi:hypothetical protein
VLLAVSALDAFAVLLCCNRSLSEEVSAGVERERDRENVVEGVNLRGLLAQDRRRSVYIPPCLL